MSKAMRSSGRVGLAALIVIGLVGTLVGVRILALGQSQPALLIADTNVVDPTFAIGPIDGLTSSWYLAPPVTSIPLGTYVQLHQPASPHSIVKWTGAEEVARDAQGSTAECWLLEPGPHVVRVDVFGSAQGSSGHVEELSSSCILRVVNIPLDHITVSVADVWVDPVEIDESLPQDQLNELTMDYFFGLSIAALRDLGNGRYRTSVDRLVHMTVAVNPPGFAPLMEWRFDGNAREIGASTTTWFTDIGNHVAEVGPLLNPAQIEIETYSVTITSHTSGEDIIPEGEPIVFTAETDPPGYEADITWLSSTMYGTAEPILSEGPVFIAEFNDTWGPWPENPDVLFQWLGVKADNVAFNQDQKTELDFSIVEIEVCPLPDETFQIDFTFEFNPGSEGFPQGLEIEYAISIQGPETLVVDAAQTVKVWTPQAPQTMCDNHTPPDCSGGTCDNWIVKQFKAGQQVGRSFEWTAQCAGSIQGECSCVANPKPRKKKKPKHDGQGNYNITIELDPNNLIRETDETNNVMRADLREDDPSCPTGACCLPDGSCVDGLVGYDCEQLGGSYQGNDTTCATAKCPVLGACVFEELDLCVLTTEAGCTELDYLSGVFQGEGTSCPD